MNKHSAMKIDLVYQQLNVVRFNSSSSRGGRTHEARKHKSSAMRNLGFIRVAVFFKHGHETMLRNADGCRRDASR